MSTSPPRAPDASMSLITSMIRRPLDPGYAEAAKRRRRAGLPQATPTRTVLVVVMALLIGFMFAVSAKALRPKPSVAAQARAELIERIETLQSGAAQSEAQIRALTKEVRGYEEMALAQSGAPDLTTQIEQYALQAGLTPLAGPGLTLTLDDATSAGTDAQAGTRPSGGFDSGRVAAGDLQIVVNGLWGAGAEAISINGQRLTSTAAIRFAGQAVIVDFRPLSRPYVITALGDPEQMQRVFGPSFAGVYLDQLTRQYGIRAAFAASKALTVPGDSSMHVEFAKPIPSDVPSARPPTTGSGS
ncbi:MAG: DUF881 domain-containing protein [Intrasporangium sp.]|uniref:DUF881 domain-containing protein n=1 Tax=Intrasporangium sp. TaxID=1925024 RepID=UPI0026493783|nr:DUF881 domain-containing protein [Intrasporangium sp.]MDN5794599.1 DUF881 domain-containing protein [Intrasporangium sp.]